VIEGKTIALRCLEQDDLPLVAQWRNQQEIRRSFFHKALIPLSGQRKWYERYLDKGTDQIFVAVTVPDGRPVGMIGLYRIDPLNHKAELGSTIVGDRSQWGKGLGSEMISLLLDYAFTDLNLNRVYAYAIDYNQASVKAKLKCGFTIEGTMREDHYTNGRYHDVYLLGITRADWEKRAASVDG